MLLFVLAACFSSNGNKERVQSVPKMASNIIYVRTYKTSS